MRSFDGFIKGKTVIGMLHLAGTNPIDRALEEAEIYADEGINGVIVEDYHGSVQDVDYALGELSKMDLPLKIGVNVLVDPYYGFELSEKYNVDFVQFDSVESHTLDVNKYSELRNRYPDVGVLGGVGFKYQPKSDKSLRDNLRWSASMCDAVVTTGAGTGIETSLDKLIDYRNVLRNFPLVVGAGVTADNVESQLKIADAAIVGSYFKPKGNTQAPVERELVQNLMNNVIYGARRS